VTKSKPKAYTARPRREPVTFRLRSDLIRLVEYMAERGGETRSEYVERIVTAAVENGRAA